MMQGLFENRTFRNGKISVKYFVLSFMDINNNYDIIYVII